MHAYISFVSCNAFNYQCLFSVMDTHVCKRQSFKSLRLPSRACMQRAKASGICMLMSLRARQQQPATRRPPTIVVIVNLQNVATKLCTGSHVQQHCAVIEFNEVNPRSCQTFRIFLQKHLDFSEQKSARSKRPIRSRCK
jgi:hypothetical protein